MSVETVDPPSPSAYVWRMSPFIVLLIVMVAALNLWLFWDGLAYMWVAWTESPEYSHAALIPPIAAFLIWQQKDRLERISFTGSWWGVALVFVGGGLLLLGQLATIYTLVQYAYLVTLYGLVLAFTGTRAFRWLTVPLLILVLMIPLPQFVLANLSTKLQLLSSELGVWFMRLFDISVYLEGNVIDLGGYKLQVAEACSGLRYLFPLMTMGFLMAYFYKGATWKRGALFVSSIPITLVMNSIRVGTVGLMVERWGIGMAEGFLHEFQGWAVFMVCTGMLLGEIAILNRIGHESGTWRQLFGVEFPAPTPHGAVLRHRRLPTAFIAASSVLFIFMVAALVLPRPAELIPTRASLLEFPMQVDAWTGRRSVLEGVYLDTLKLDDYLLADYTKGGAHPINLYISYYNSQRKGEAVHSPRACLPGGGWELRDFDQRTLPGVQIDGQPLLVNRTLIQLGNQRQLVYYWFQQRGRIIDNEFVVKWYLFWDALTRHRTDGAMVRIITPLRPDSSEVEADHDLTEFASRIAPDLHRYVPN
jgi:exosortase D (VPLPA-CTERM-specific)